MDEQVICPECEQAMFNDTSIIIEAGTAAYCCTNCNTTLIKIL